jgi:D-beta-D-heptose 7-phosphate kinase/D-beta-D-heptose 1-phosphate adenosyltransferase
MSFSDPTPLQAVEMVKPDFLIKGADYRGGPIVGDEFVKARGGKVIFIPELIGPLARTTTLIERLKEL